MGVWCFVYNRNSADEELLSEIERADKFGEIDETRHELCVDLPTYEHTDGNYYCILHLPKKDKNVNEFSKVISSLLRKVKAEITDIEKLSEDKQEAKKDKLIYDFRYVWFPCNFSLRSETVKVKANFKAATFCYVADFLDTKFLGYANFGYVSFCGKTNFKMAKFNANAYFYAARFLDKTEFQYTFFSNGKFTKAMFSDIASFEGSEFARDANFINVNFLKGVNFQYSKLSIANFENAKFSNIVNFKSVKILNSASFKGEDENLIFDKNAILDLQHANN